MKPIPELGVGLIYFSGLESVVRSLSGYIHALEVEPQTSWFKESLESDSFSYDKAFTDFLCSQPQPKIFHGVGFPVGGSVGSHTAHFKTLNAQIDAVRPAYTSEHLSFNKFYGRDGRLHQTNFLLPPLQNENGVRTAAAAIRAYKSEIDLPFAFETGTNYLQPRPLEIPDGEFIARVAEESDAYILLDLHNLLANELNGRQRVKDLIDQLPLERVAEIHLAGGMYLNNYYLDAHSSVSSQELLDLTEAIVRRLPCLRSIIFEMLPEYLNNGITEKDVKRQLIAMNRLWEQRGSDQKKQRPAKQAPSPSHAVTTAEWECTLGSLVNGMAHGPGPLYKELEADKGTGIIKDLVFEFRASSIVGALKMTTRLIKLHLGSQRFNQLLRAYCAANESEIFGVANAMRFAGYLKDVAPPVPFLDDMLSFELNAIQTQVDGITRTVDFEYDPYPLLEDLVNYRKPAAYPPAGAIYRIEIKPDEPEHNNKEALRYHAVFHN